jgi:hypothetical protein
MHSVLLFVEKPTTEDPAILQVWRNFWGAAQKTVESTTGTQTLGESCWLIDLQTSVHAFADIVHAAKQYQFRYRVLFLQDPPKWIDSSKSS